jgi:hypothetical protein
MILETESTALWYEDGKAQNSCTVPVLMHVKRGHSREVEIQSSKHYGTQVVSPVYGTFDKPSMIRSTSS